MRYHGNYCGPYWSAGKHQGSVISPIPAIDEFDETCKEHDAAYAVNQALESADYSFARRNLATLNPKRIAAGLAVGAQAVGRTIDRLLLPNNNLSKHAMPGHLRGSAPNIKTQTTTKVVTRGLGKAPQRLKKFNPRLESVDEVLSIRKQQGGSTIVRAPATVSNQFRPVRSKKTQLNDGIRIQTTVMAGRAAGASQSTVPEIVFSFPLTPLSTNNAEIQQLCQLYEQYRFNSITLHYHPYQGTSNGGEVMLVAFERAIDILPNSNNANFYTRCLSGENAVLTPIWCPVSMDVVIDNTWKVVDPYNAATIYEFTSGFVYMLVDGTTIIPGYLSLDIDIEFATMKYNPRNVVSGSYQGPSQSFAGTLTTAVSAAGTNFLMTFAGAAFTPGDLYHTTFVVGGATPPTGTTFANLLQISNGTNGTATPYVLRNNSTLYSRALTATTIQLYYTWSVANEGTGSVADAEVMEIATTTSAVGAFPSVRFTQLSNSTAPTN